MVCGSDILFSFLFLWIGTIMLLFHSFSFFSCLHIFILIWYIIWCTSLPPFLNSYALLTSSPVGGSNSSFAVKEVVFWVLLSIRTLNRSEKCYLHLLTTVVFRYRTPQNEPSFLFFNIVSSLFAITVQSVSTCMSHIYYFYYSTYALNFRIKLGNRLKFHYKLRNEMKL